jgi:hypothetical protein
MHRPPQGRASIAIAPHHWRCSAYYGDDVTLTLGGAASGTAVTTGLTSVAHTAG